MPVTPPPQPLPSHSLPGPQTLLALCVLLPLLVVLGCRLMDSGIPAPPAGLRISNGLAATAAAERSQSGAPERGELTLSINQLAATACPRTGAYVTVADADGRPVAALESRDFTVFSGGELVDGARVQPASVAGAPVSVALVMDYGESMDTEAVAGMEGAAASFIDNLAAEERGMVIKFATLGEIVQAYTADKTALKAAIAGRWMPGGTRTLLYDAVYRAVADTARQPGRRAVLVITDGRDDASRHTLEAVIAFAGEKRVPVFAVGLGQADTASLAQLAAGTGGRYYHAPDPAALAGIHTRMAEILKGQYLVSYRETALAGRAHALEVIVETDNQVAGDILQLEACSAPASHHLSGHRLPDPGDPGMAISEGRGGSLTALESALGDLAAAAGHRPMDVAVAAPYGYIAAGEGGLMVADVTAPGAPRLIATVRPDQMRVAAASRRHLSALVAVAVHPPHLFVLDAQEGFAVVRVEDPQRIYYQVELGLRGHGLWVAGRHLYITTGTGLSIYDIAEPAAPDLIGQAVVDGGCGAITLAFPYLYAVRQADEGVAVIDVSRASAPLVLGTLVTEAPSEVDTVADAVDLGARAAAPGIGPLEALGVAPFHLGLGPRHRDTRAGSG